MKDCKPLSSNGMLKRRKYRHGIADVYENILNNRGIHRKPMTELAFDTCYRRYKELGGMKDFEFNDDFKLDNFKYL